MKPVLSGRVHAALETTDEQVEYCLKARSEMRAALSNLLKNDGILVIPTAPAPPKLRSKGRQLEDFLSSAFSLSSVAGMSGCCQVSVPLGKYDGCPVSVSLVAKYGADRFLLDTLRDLYPSLHKKAEEDCSKAISIDKKNVKAYLRRGTAREILCY
jgi:Asp-tRNA(Asn)/Glu-tRNA(Gln) amidotransferase A subunit family amidase